MSFAPNNGSFAKVDGQGTVSKFEVRTNYPDIAATMSDEKIPTDLSPASSFIGLSAVSSALLLNIL